MSKSSPNTVSPDGADARPSEAQEATPRRATRSRVWWSARAVLLVLGAPVLMVAIAFVALIGREVTAPSWMVRDVETRAAQVLAGGSLDFGAMKVTVGDDLHPRLVVQNAVLRDADGAVMARVPRIEGLVSPRGVLQGRFLAQQVTLRGAQISLRRARDGTIAFAFDRAGTELGAADGFIGLLEQMDQLFEARPLEALEQVRAEGLIINYSDARAGRSWIIDNGRIGLDIGREELALRANAELLSGRSYVTQAEVTYRSPRGSRAAEVGVNITDAAAPDIASQSLLVSWLEVLDAPISGAMRGELDTDGRLTTVSATLRIGEGELRPTAATRPIPFRSARTYFSYNPIEELLNFDLIEIDSALGRVSGVGQTYLRDFTDRYPETFLGQVAFDEIEVTVDDVLQAPVSVSQAMADFRLRLNPFTFDIGQASIETDQVPLRFNGQVQATTEGWSVALDAQANAVDARDVLSLWPAGAAPRTRGWLAQNIQSGELRDATVAYRGVAGQPEHLAMTMEFAGADVQFMRTMPPIEDGRGTLSLIDKRFVIALDGGHVAAPEGGQIDLTGSTFVIPQTGPRAPALIDLEMQGRLTAAMSLLNLEPFGVLRNSDLPVSFAQGQARITASIATPLARDVTAQDREWSATATLRNIRSEALLPGQVLTSSRLQVRVDPDSLTIQGPVRTGDIGGDITFARALGAGSEGTARLDIAAPIGPAFLRNFGINLPRGMVTGEAPATIALDLSQPEAPSFRLTSTLRGVGLSLAGVGWSKTRDARGALTVEGQLGAQPRIDLLAIEAPGLEARGSVQLAAGGGLERAAFDRVRLGGWLDAPVILVGRGAGRAAEVRIATGTLDLRSANFGSGRGGAGADGGGAGAGGPLVIALDRLQVTDNITIDNFRGSFTSAGGLQGDFSGNVNGAAPVNGTVVPVDGGAAVRIVSADAGALMRATGLLRGALGGSMQMTLVPAGGGGSYDGVIEGRDLRVRDAPALASLLDAISVVGLLTQLDGQGLMFREVDARFRLTPDQVIITQASAVGPSIGLSLDGVYGPVTRQMDLQGVVSPIYLLNGIGSVLTRPGEGLFGFNFNLRGSVDSPRVTVNPLSALTPGMFRDIFRRPPPTVGQ